MSSEDCRSLDDLWRIVNDTHTQFFPENKLMPIVGNGRIERPDYMFVFINPTHRNISSNPLWKGPRFPFIGTKPVWRIFNRAGLFDDELMKQIEREPNWSLEFTEKVRSFLDSKSFYFTNIVKWTGADATLPDAQKVKLFLPILRREIEIVQPKTIVTFGLIPFTFLTQETIRLQDYYDKFVQSSKLAAYPLKVGNHQTSVVPCYFPVGRGDPKRAVEMLKAIK